MKPPCFKIQCVQDNFEDSRFCVSFGKIGFKWFDEHRLAIMRFTTMITLVCITLSIVAVVATSKDNSDVKNTCWTYGRVDASGGTVYVGLEKYIYEVNGSTYDAEWGDEMTCDNIIDGETSFCEDCKDACNSAIPTAIINLITFFPTLTTDLNRMTNAGDMNCQKFMGILTGVISFSTTVVALQSFQAGCYVDLPSSVNGKDITYYWGPGFICLLLSTILKWVDIIIHICMPVVADSTDDNIERKEALSTHLL